MDVWGQQLYQKETLTQVFSCEICDIFKNTFLQNSSDGCFCISGITLETGLWPAKENVEYRTMMLCQCIINSDFKRIAKKILKEQEKPGNLEILYHGFHSKEKIRVYIKNTVNTKIKMEGNS